MSFKRDKNDSSLLHNLQKRRVADHLALHIPSNEAHLLKNGKYACTVCSKRPVFDTIEMLAVHRKGKKHLFCLSKFLEKQEELKNCIIKRKHENLCNDKGELSLSLEKKSKIKLSEAVYCSLAMRRRSNKRPSKKIELIPTAKSSAKCSNSPQANSDQFSTGPEKNIASSNSTNDTINRYVKSIKSRQSFSDLVQSIRSNPYKTNNNVKSSTHYFKTEENMSGKQATKSETRGGKQLNDNGEIKKKLTYYSNLRSNGWKKDLSGNWIKDEDAEFDTDEEEPTDYPC